MLRDLFLSKTIDIMVNEDVSFAEAKEIFQERMNKKAEQFGHEVGSFLVFFISNLKVVFCMR